MKCMICNAECDGKIVIGDIQTVDGGDFIVCNDCLSEYASGDYDKLAEKLENNPEYIGAEHRRK